MDASGIKSSGVIRPQDAGGRRQVRRPAVRGDVPSESGDRTSRQHARQRVPDAENLVSANGRTYDRTAPKGTYLNIMI